MIQVLNIDMSKESERRVLFEALKQLRGLHTFEIKANRKLRTTAQNRLYWGVYIAAYRDYMCQQGQPFSDNFLHKLLADRFLRKTEFNSVTGEFLGDITLSTTELTIPEFNQYLDNVGSYLGETYHIQIPTREQFIDDEAVHAAGRGR